MKKILLGAALLITSMFAKAQNGLENVIVEKYYVSNAADAAGSVGVLPTGSVTYRVFVDMLPGYNFQALYGVTGHTLLVQTSTTFFNNEDYGGTTPSNSTTNVRKNSVLLDSYFSVGGTATGRVGVLKTDDTDGSPGNAQSILQNTDGTFTPINIGAAASLSAFDGMMPGSPVAVTYVGINNTGNGDLGVLDGISQVGGLFSTANGSVAALGGAVGLTPATNRVLVGQFTTDGVFHFELNVQIGTPTGGVQNYVSSAPVGSEITAAFLTQTLGAANIPPTVSITSPANGASFLTGAAVAIAASAADADGNVTQVEFFVDGGSIGIDNTAPYTATWVAVNGSHCITAIATDNSGATTTSSPQTCVTVASNPPPTVSITNPANGASFITGSLVTIDATASDNGSVTQVEFKVGALSVGIDATAPYSATWTSVAGSHCITAIATDNLGATTTTVCTNITVANNPPPTVSITAPSAGSSFISGATVNVAANASDNGSVTQVEFFDGVTSIGVDATSPYTGSFVAGALGTHCITAVATDNLGLTATTACTNINVVSTILPYKVTTTSGTCVPPTFCIPIEAVASVDNIIGYDLTVQYDAAKVTPTGVITVYGDLITASYVDAISAIGAGTMDISLFFNATAPPTAKFSGVGRLICVEFSKTAAFASIDTVSFTVPFLQESYFTGVQSMFVDNGSHTTYKDSSFNADLKFWNTGTALAYDALVPATYLITNINGTDALCANPSATAVQPNTLGQFSYNTNNGVDVQITRDILGTTDVQPVVNGFDALQARKVLLSDLTFIPNAFQMVATDVNIDGVVSAGDVSQINQRAVLLIPEFKQAWNYNAAGQSNGQPSKDWLFIDSTITAASAAYQISTTYPAWNGTGFNKQHSPVVPFCLAVPIVNPSTCPIISKEIYKGVMLGDINGNFATVGSGGIFRNNGTDKVVFDMSHAIISNGYIDVPVSVISNDEVNALDFALQYNHSNLSYNTVVDNTNSLDALANYNEGDNTLRFTSNSLTKYAINKPVVSIRFATANANLVTEQDLSSVVGYINGEQVATEVIARNASSTSTAANMVSIFPNPASTVLNVVAYENATIQLMDVSGRQIILQTNVNANEKHEINLQGVANGVYIIKINGESFASTQKVVVNK